MTAAQQYRGMGQTSSSQQKSGLTTGQYVALGVGAGTTIASIAASNAPISTKVETSFGTALLTGAAVPSPASPFLAIAGGISELLGALGVGSGCGDTCVLSSKYANQAESLLKQNRDIYEAIPTPRPMSLQQEALSNFDTIWNDLQQQCSNPSLGNAGKRCISDRARGGKFDWFGWYRDPIANDTNVYNDSQTPQLTQTGSPSTTSANASSVPVSTTGNVSAIPSLTSLLSGSNSTYLILGGIALIAIIAVTSSGGK